MPKVVRLKPYNRRKGYLLRRFVLGNQKYMQDRWYHVGDGVAAKLAKVHSRPDHPEDSPLAFDIYDTHKEAKAQFAAEQEAEREATIKNPEFVGTLTTKDLESDNAKAGRTERAEANLERAEKKRAEGKAGDDAEKTSEDGDGGKSAADDDPAFQ